MLSLIKKVLKPKELAIAMAIYDRLKLLFAKEEASKAAPIEEVDEYTKLVDTLYKEFWRWSYFTPQEVFKRGVNVGEITPEVLANIAIVLDKLTEIRAIYGEILVNSFFRDTLHNERVGGKKSSYHLEGMAADIRSQSIVPKDLAKIAAKYFKGVIIYDNFIHVDLRKTKYHAREKNGVFTKIKI